MEQSHQSVILIPISVNRSKRRNMQQGKITVSSLQWSEEGARREDGGSRRGPEHSIGPKGHFMDPIGYFINPVGYFMEPTEHLTDPTACKSHAQPWEQSHRPCRSPSAVQLAFGDGHSADARRKGWKAQIAGMSITSWFSSGFIRGTQEE